MELYKESVNNWCDAVDDFAVETAKLQIKLNLLHQAFRNKVIPVSQKMYVVWHAHVFYNYSNCLYSEDIKRLVNELESLV